MRARHVAVFALVAAAACSSSSKEPANVTLAPSFLGPKDLFSGLTSINLTVYDSAAGVDCDTTTGNITGADGATPLQMVTLTNQGCPPQYKWCGSLTIQESDTDRIFQAVGMKNSSEAAVGCSRTAIKDAAPQLSITMERYVPAAMCHDGTIQPTEQCEGMPSSKSFSCDDSCHSIEVLLSVGNAQNNTLTGAKGNKFAPYFLWPETSGNDGRFIAFFTDNVSDQTNKVNDVGMRVLSDGWNTMTSPVAATLGELLLPNGTAFPSTPAPGAQDEAQGALQGGKYYVVFQDDQSPMGTDIHLRSMDSSFVADQAAGAALTINGTTCTDATTCTGEANQQSYPAISAGPGGKLLIAWQDDKGPNPGSIQARTFTPPNVLGNQFTMSTGTMNTNVVLASTSNGWIAVWQSGDDVKLRTINAAGTPNGAESIVNDDMTGLQDHGSVASLSDGRFAVVFAEHNNADGVDIVLQRFNASGAKLAGDQMVRVNNVVTAGDQLMPVIAGTSAASGAFAIAWLDAASNHIRARIADGTTGYLPNSIDGQDQEFQASITDGKTRTNPVVVAGGAGRNVIIGWEDQSATGAGIVARLFPPPSQ
jgi:hypothetical protein